MIEPLLPALIVVPLLAAGAVFVVAERWVRIAGLAGGGAAFLLALYVFLLPPSAAPDLRAAYAAPDGPLEAALERRGLDDPAERAAFRDLLQGPAPAPAEVQARLGAVALVPLARVRAADAPPGEAAAAARDVREAEARAHAYAQLLDELERGLGPLRRSAAAPAGERYRLATWAPWIPALGVHAFLAVDGLSAVFLLVAALLVVVGLAAAPAGAGLRGSLALLLLLEASLVGLLVSLDLVLFYAFWVLSLLPAWGLVVRGGAAADAAAALRGVLGALLGAAALLAAAAAVGVAAGQGGVPAFALPDLTAAGALGPGVQALAFAGVLAACAARLPLPPVHGWLAPVVERAAPLPAGILQALTLLAGAYGLYRVAWPLAPDVVSDASVTSLLSAWAALAALWGGLLLVGRANLPRALAGATLAQGGFVLLGLASGAPAGLSGGALLVVAHAAGAAAARLALGRLGGDGAGLPGAGRRAPVLAGLGTLALLSLAGLPGLASFPALLLVLVGAWSAPAVPVWVFAAAAAAALLVATGCLRLVHELWLGEPAPDADVRELTPGDAAALVPLAVLALAVGLYPRLVLDALGPTLDALAAVLVGV